VGDQIASLPASHSSLSVRGNPTSLLPSLAYLPLRCSVRFASHLPGSSSSSSKKKIRSVAQGPVGEVRNCAPIPPIIVEAQFVKAGGKISARKLAVSRPAR
jgi:hypothetical protein